jgi:hypothetical protein
MDKKIKLVFSPDLYRAAKIKADQAGQTLEAWLMTIVLQQLDSSDSIPALDWGRIDSRIDQRTVFLERRLDVLADRLDQLCKHRPADWSDLSTSATSAMGATDDSPVDFCLSPESPDDDVADASVTRLTA